MADEIDRANEQAEFMLSHQLKVRKFEPKPCGACHYCNEPVQAERLFCDADCAKDWEREENLRSNQGQRGRS